MRRQRYIWWIGALAIALSACAGGSGSSGFDVALAERAAISAALTEMRCVDIEQTQLTICPADVMTPPGAPGAIETGLDQARNILCVVGAMPGSCSFSIPFMPEGLPPDAAYRVAIRAVDPPGDWHISAVPSRSPSTEAPAFDAPVTVNAPDAAPQGATEVQIAILVYLDATEMVPEVVANLSDSGADFAYVLEATLNGVR